MAIRVGGGAGFTGAHRPGSRTIVWFPLVARSAVSEGPVADL